MWCQLVRASRERAALVSDKTIVMSCGDLEPATSCKKGIEACLLGVFGKVCGGICHNDGEFSMMVFERASSMRSLIGRQLMSAFRVFLDMARATPGPGRPGQSCYCCNYHT